MTERNRGTRRGRMVLIGTAIAVLGLLVASVAYANNLDRRTAQNAAKYAAKKECQRTTGCYAWGASNVHLLTHHKALGKTYVNVQRSGVNYQCRRQIVITLNPDTGDIRYSQSRRKCYQI